MCFQISEKIGYDGFTCVCYVYVCVCVCVCVCVSLNPRHSMGKEPFLLECPGTRLCVCMCLHEYIHLHEWCVKISSMCLSIHSHAITDDFQLDLMFTHIV